jgi:hypothetical protein
MWIICSDSIGTTTNFENGWHARFWPIQWWNQMMPQVWNGLEYMKIVLGCPRILVSDGKSSEYHCFIARNVDLFTHIYRIPFLCSVFQWFRSFHHYLLLICFRIPFICESTSRSFRPAANPDHQGLGFQRWIAFPKWPKPFRWLSNFLGSVHANICVVSIYYHRKE